MQIKNLSKRKGLTDFCKSVRPFLFILFVLVQFLYQQITEALRWDNLVPVACVILVLLALVLLVTGQAVGAAVLLVLAFLASPFGLPAIAAWLADGLDSLRDAIRQRI